MDAVAKRHFRALVFALIAVAAYLQALGMGWIVAAELAPLPGRTQPAVTSAASSPEVLHETSAAAILSRNPFDSATGLLDRPSMDDAPPPPRTRDDPYSDPACAAMRVTFIAASEDAEWSFAVIAPGRERPHLYRRGDAVAGQTLLHVAWDRLWLTGDDGRCQLELHGKREPLPPPAAPKQPTRPGRSKLPPEIASKIHKISETEFNVDRSAIDLVLEQQAALMKTARIAPLRKDGEIVGVRMQKIGAGSLLDTLGLKKGDVVQSINGLSIADPEKALQAYARLRTADRLEVALQRGGKNTTLQLHIR